MTLVDAPPKIRSARLVLWPGRALYLGPLLANDAHSHHAIQVTIALEGELRVSHQFGDRMRRATMLVTPADELHSISTAHTTAQLYLDPDTLPPAFGARWRPGVTIRGLFGQRLRLAVRHALHESLPCLELAEDFTRARVTLWDFAAWADDLEVPCPPDFPRADPKPAAPSARRARTDPGFLRQADLLASVVPFSAATLWRKVKKGTFPRPIKLSEGVTAWSQHDVKHWIEERAQASAKKKPRNRK